MPKFHLSLRTRRELHTAYILNRPGIKWGMVWSSHALSSTSTSLPSAISDLEAQLGVQDSEISWSYILLIAIVIVVPLACMLLCALQCVVGLHTFSQQPHFLLLSQVQQ